MTISANYPTIAPSLNLDFANSQQLDTRINFTRSTNNATYYDGETSALAEQNLQPNSQTIGGTGWSFFSGSLTGTTNYATAPNGTTTASQVVETTVTSSHVVLPSTSFTAVAGLVYTFSVFAKIGVLATPASVIQLYANNTAFTAGWANFNLATPAIGTFGTGVVGTPTITSVGDGWYRCVMSVTATATNTASIQMLLVNNNASASFAPSYAGSTTTDIL
jgi:hypothetical protein